MNVVPVFVSEIRRKHDFYALQAVLLAKLVADPEQMLRIFQNDVAKFRMTYINLYPHNHVICASAARCGECSMYLPQKCGEYIIN